MKTSNFLKPQTFSQKVSRILHFLDSMLYPLIQPSLEYQRNQGQCCSRQFPLIFLGSFNGTIDKTMLIVSIKKFLFNFWYLICWKAGYACCSVQVTNDSILLYRYATFGDQWASNFLSLRLNSVVIMSLLKLSFCQEKSLALPELYISCFDGCC